MSHPVTRITVVATLILAIGCGSDGPADPVEEFGSIRVTTTTTGNDVDPGFLVTVDGPGREIASNGTLDFADLSPGVYGVTLSEIADNCAVNGDNPKSATVAAAQMTGVDFVATCSALVSEQVLLAADRGGDIYEIDPATGLETLFLTLFMDDGAGGQDSLGVVSAMLWVEETMKLWIGTGGNGVCSGCVLVWPGVGANSGNEVTQLSFAPNGVSGLSVNPTDGAIYSFESDGTNLLYEIDAITGVFDTIQSGLSLQNGGGGTTVGADGTLYVATGDELWIVDPSDGATTLVDTMTYTGFPGPFTESSQTIGAMTTNPVDGTVLGILKDGGRSGTLQPTYLVRVNLDTAEITYVGRQALLMDGLAWAPRSVFGG